MKQHISTLFSLLLGSAVLLVTGCKSDPVPNFMMNEHDIASSDVQPDLADSTKLLKVYVGDSVYFKDISDPINDVDHRYWEFTGDSTWDVEDEEFTAWVFDFTGIVQVLFCVNDEKNCVSKWIAVQEHDDIVEDSEPEPDLEPEPPQKDDQESNAGGGDIIPPPPPPPPLPPSIEIVTPLQKEVETAEANYEVEVKAMNVRKKEQLAVTVNGQKIGKLDFAPKSGKLVAKLPLKEGGNEIVISAKTAGGSVEETVSVTYKPKKAPPKPTKTLYATAGIATSSRQATPNCTASVKETTLSITLMPQTDVELRTFTVFTYSCGGLNVSIRGPGIKQDFTAELNKGKSQVSFSDVEASLDAGKTYTLTFTTFAPTNDCTSNTPPRFEAQTCSNVKSVSTDQLKIDQKGNLILFDLKYSYKQ